MKESARGQGEERTRAELTRTTDHVNTNNLVVVVLSVNSSRSEDVLPRALETRVESSDEVGGHEDWARESGSDEIEVGDGGRR